MSGDSVPMASGSDMNSLAAVWAYILPALNHVMRSQPDSLDAPPLDVNYHMGVYTVVYNFATASRADKGGGRNDMLSHGFNFGLPSSDDYDDDYNLEDASKDWNLDRVERIKSMVGYELYCHLESYFRTIARDIRDMAPNDDASFLSYYLKSYARFASGVAIINRLFAYLNRHFITRAVDEGMGWISLADVLKEKPRSPKKSKKDIELLESRKKDALKAWGYNGGSLEQRRFAESCAEAGSPTDRIVPVASLAHRCWRQELIEPFLSSGVPKTAGEIALNGHVDPKAIGADHPVSSRISGTENLSLSSSSSRLSSPVTSYLAPAVNGTTPPSAPPLSKSAKKNKKKKKNKGKEKEKEKDSEELDPDSAPPETNDPSAPQNVPSRSSSPSSTALVPIPPPPPPKGRLNRAVGELIMTGRGPVQGGSAKMSARDAALKLSKSLRASGVGPDNLIRKRLDKFLKG